MGKLVSYCASLGAIALAFASPVRAQQALFVANWGNDMAACTETTPCLTFQGAINKGSVTQITCLTSGSYGPFIVTASIVIDCGAGNVGNIYAPTAFTNAINISGAGASVILRHLSLNGNGTATAGIYASSFTGSLILEECAIQGFAYGVDFVPATGRGLLQVSNSQIINNATGINVASSGNTIASLALNRVELVGNSNIGLTLGGSGVIAGTMHDSLIASGTDGIYAAAGQLYFAIDGSNITANLQFGINTVNAGVIIGVGTTSFSGNGTAVKADAGSLVSFGNNQMIANANNGNFTATVPLR
jgi:hypothetical protein